MQGSFRNFSLGMWNRYPARFGWMFELMVASFHRYLKPPICYQQLNNLTTSHSDIPVTLCMLHTTKQ